LDGVESVNVEMDDDGRVIVECVGRLGGYKILKIAKILFLIPCSQKKKLSSSLN
jgi:hypothetical protein